MRARSWGVVGGECGDGGVDAEELEIGDEVLDESVGFERGHVSAGGDDLWISGVELGDGFELDADGAACCGEDAKAHGVCGVEPEGPAFGFGHLEWEEREGGGVLVEGLEHHGEAGDDDAATEDALAVDEVDGDGGADVDDEACLLGAGVGGEGAEPAVLADGGGVVEVVLEGDGDVAADESDGVAIGERCGDVGDGGGCGGVDGSDGDGRGARGGFEESGEGGADGVVVGAGGDFDALEVGGGEEAEARAGVADTDGDEGLVHRDNGRAWRTSTLGAVTSGRGADVYMRGGW